MNLNPQINPQETRVLVAMSGGVDSSVAAALLKSQGYQVIGVHMQLWDHGDANLERMGGRCCSLVDSNDARRVCDKIGVPYYVINAQDVFREKVVDYFVHEYLKNRTPNPCVECNNKIKFHYLFQKADELGCTFIATGHYSQIQHDAAAGFSRLIRAKDANKDQSYFLFGLTQKAVSRTLMPLGGMNKPMVRKLAEEFKLPVAQKEDSMDICFVGSDTYANFVDQNSSPSLRPDGVIQTKDGAVIGAHTGAHRFTIGQRKGLQLSGGQETHDYYVIDINAKTHAVIVGEEADLFKKSLVASKVNWIRPIDQLRPLRCKAKIRSRSDESDCWVTCFENSTVEVEFDQPQRAITAGQAVVFYEGDEILGGGFIDRAGTA